MVRFTLVGGWGMFLLVIAPYHRHKVSSFHLTSTQHQSWHTTTTTTRASGTTRLMAHSDEMGTSAAGRERREEEKRRKDRKSEVIPGKTSAIPGEQDFALDPTSTENAYLQSASREEQEVFKYTESAMQNLRMLKVEESAKAFDAVFKLRPSAYCWQAGIAKYYLGEYSMAADIFARSAAIYESKFGAPASEERIWRDACELKYWSLLSRKEKETIREKGGIKTVFPQIRELDILSSDDLMSTTVETRRVIRIAKDLFQASIENEAVSLVLSRAKLRSICGALDKVGSRPTVDRKMWKINSCFYLGLHYDALGEEEESKKCMKMALRLSASGGNGNDIIHTLPILHMSKRDWFDDDEFEEEIVENTMSNTSRERSVKIPLGVKADPLIAQSIQDSISKMKHDELRTALKTRGLKHTGAKEDLQSRLFNSLVEDVGLQL